VIPLIIVMIIFAWGWKGSLDMTVVPADARQYKAAAKQWNWTFYYPNDTATSTGQLWLEVDKPAAFTLESSDVLHAFYMPAMRVKRDVVPGQYHTIWFHPTRLGDFHLFCAEYCGNDHSLMYAQVHVVTAATYATRPWDQWSKTDLVDNGKKVWQQQCKSCHSIDGSIVVGPSFKGIWGKKETVLVKGAEQQVDVDEAYVIESIRDPEAKKVKGFADKNMTPFKSDLPDERIKWVIEFLKTLAAK
jgi:cytochrome c oxidase subunit 2